MSTSSADPAANARILWSPLIGSLTKSIGANCCTPIVTGQEVLSPEFSGSREGPELGLAEDVAVGSDLGEFMLDNSHALTVAIVAAKPIQENQILTHKVCRTVANVSRLEIQDSRAMSLVLEMQDRKTARTLLTKVYLPPHPGRALEDSFSPYVRHRHRPVFIAASPPKRGR